MTRREELEAEIAEQSRMASHYSRATSDASEEYLRRYDLLRAAKEALAALPPDPPPFRVSEAVSRKALEARGRVRGYLHAPTALEHDRAEHAALIQGWVEEQFPNTNSYLLSIREIRAKAGLT